jgi:5'-methylthioadenosine phosphorylase
VPDQFIDRTHGRKDTFFGDGAAAHIAFADPICGDLARAVADAAEAAGGQVHRGGTYLCMEGPAFSTRAESLLYRSWGVDVIGMTNLQEAKLAREAEICYATMAMVTDYDCWHQVEESVSVEMLLGNLRRNSALAQKAIRMAVRSLAPERGCPCCRALEHALITPAAQIPAATRSKLDLIIGKYL